MNIHQVQEEPHSYKATDNRKTENVTTERPEMKKTKQRFVTFSNFKNFAAQNIHEDVKHLNVYGTLRLKQECTICELGNSKYSLVIKLVF